VNGGFAFVALAVAAAGFIIASRCYLVRYQIARESGHRLYLAAITYGFACISIAILPIGFIAWAACLEISPYLLGIATALTGLGFTELFNRRLDRSQLPAAWAALKSLSFREVVIHLWNAWERDDSARVKALWRAWEKDDIELVCATALSEFKPVAVTVESGKVYVGLVADTIEPSSDKSYLSILPFYSGYRDKETHSLRLNHKYESLINGLLNEDPDIIASGLDYVIVVPKERIITIHIFNDQLYNEVSGHSLDDVGKPAAEKQPDPPKP